MSLRHQSEVRYGGNQPVFSNQQLLRQRGKIAMIGLRMNVASLCKGTTSVVRLRLILMASLLAVVGGTDVSHSSAQSSGLMPADSMLLYQMPVVVVTATRSPRSLREVPISTEVVLAEEIETRGVFRLSDLLSEQTGLNIIHEFGAGVQMQGLSSDYVLILVDGDPVIGRSGGTLDLDRLTLRGLDRIEIVRGPSSSLYGSDALAGVINLVTRESTSPFEASLAAQFETHSTADISLTSEFLNGPISGTIVLDRYSSGGYDLFEDRVGQTAPGFVDYTASGRFAVRTGDRTRLRTSGRFGRLDQSGDIGLSFGEGSAPSASIGERTEWNVSSGLEHRLGSRLRIDASMYASRFISTTALIEEDSRFAQTYGEAELKGDVIAGSSHLITLGLGAARESVDADRVIGGRQNSSAEFVYAQHQWTLSKLFDVVSAARFDHHSDYENRISPKFSVLVKPAESVRLRGSVGSGFKAPTFQQRFLDFRNPIGGYSVYGASGAADVLRALEADGQILRYTSASTVAGRLRAEHSWSFNFGLDLYASSRSDLRINLFHNRISDLIETILVAEEVNGQQVFSYANLERIRTQGIEVNANVTPFGQLKISAGYQYLDAADLDVLDDLRSGSVFKRVNGRDVRVTTSEYGGLFRRSRHSATLNLLYRFESAGMTASIRGVYRGRYGAFDRNGNLILDADSEYVSGYTLWNVTVSKDLSRRATLRLGAKNIFDYTEPELIPSLSGRLIFGGIELRTK